MPLASVKFQPGFDKQSTAYGAEGKWTDGENIRFRYGQPEKIGGWTKLVGDTLIGSVRDQHAWSSLDGTRHLAIGTDRKLYLYVEGAVIDITPIRASQANLTDPFNPTNGSAVVTVTDAGHGASAGDFVTFSNSETESGLDMNAEFEITSITDSSTYTVTYSSNATGDNAFGGSGVVDCEYQLGVGKTTNVYGYGFGISAWNGSTGSAVTDALNGADNGSGTITVDDGTKFADGDFILVAGTVDATANSGSGGATSAHGVTTGVNASNVPAEIMKVTGVSTHVLTVTRGIAKVNATGTVTVGSNQAGTHPDNAVVDLIWDASDSTVRWTGFNEASTTSDTVIDSRYWVLENFGEDLLALVNDGGLYKWDKSAGQTTRAAIVSANAPTASRHLILSTPDRHVILMGTETTIGTTTTQDDLFLRFSSQEDTGTWAPTSTNTAGSFRIQDGSKIMTTVRSRGSILVWTDTSLHSLQFIGAPFIFGLNQLGANCGAVSAHCAVDVNGTTFWMSQQAFYMFDGAVKKLPCSVQDYVFDDFSITQQQLVYAGINTDFNEVTWFYASKGSSYIDRSVIYNYLENTWYTNSLARTTWLDRGVYQFPYATSFSSTASGSTPTVLGLGAGASTIYVHEDGVNDDTSALEAFLQSGDFDIQDGEQMLSVARFVPDFKDQIGSANVLLSFKDYSATTSETTLDGAITDSADEITLTESANFPTSGTILIGTELITYTGHTTGANKLTDCTRGTNGTSAAAHVDSKKVINYSNVRINLNNVTPTTTKVDTRGRGRQGNMLIYSDAVNDKWRFGTLRLDVRPDGGR